MLSRQNKSRTRIVVLQFCDLQKGSVTRITKQSTLLTKRIFAKNEQSNLVLVLVLESKALY